MRNSLYALPFTCFLALTFFANPSASAQQEIYFVNDTAIHLIESDVLIVNLHFINKTKGWTARVNYGQDCAFHPNTLDSSRECVQVQTQEKDLVSFSNKVNALQYFRSLGYELAGAKAYDGGIRPEEYYFVRKKD